MLLLLTLQIIKKEKRSMTKSDAIKELLDKIYNYSDKLIITRKEIKQVEKYYIENQNQHIAIKTFLQSNEKIEAIVNKLKAGKDEIDKQLKIGKALQPGVLAECVFMQTLAKILKLKSYIDLEKNSIF